MRLLLLGTAILLAGCASAPVIPSPVETERRIGEAPSIGVESERSVGEVIYEVYDYEIRRDESSRLVGSVTIDVIAARAVLGPQTPLVKTSHRGFDVFCTASPTLTVAGRANYAHICLHDGDNDGLFDRWTSPDGPPARRGWGALDREIGFEAQSSVEMAETGDGFRYELLYQGRSAGVINVLYREYLDSLARAAFQQDLSYTLDPQGSTEISFRSIGITVHEADNNRIRYTIDRGLDVR